MKDKNLPNDYSSLSIEELTKEANRMIEDLENQKDLENSVENYQKLLKLNNIIEKEFQNKKYEIKSSRGCHSRSNTDYYQFRYHH